MTNLHDTIVNGKTFSESGITGGSAYLSQFT